LETANGYARRASCAPAQNPESRQSFSEVNYDEPKSALDPLLPLDS
jgi:hypothetical protein